MSETSDPQYRKLRASTVAVALPRLGYKTSHDRNLRTIHVSGRGTSLLVDVDYGEPPKTQARKAHEIAEDLRSVGYETSFDFKEFPWMFHVRRRA